MMRMAIIFNAPLSWNLLLRIFTYCVVAQSVMVTGSIFDSTSTMTNVDTNQRKTQAPSTRTCDPGTDRCMSVDYAITTSNDATTRQLHPTEIVQTSNTVVVGGVTFINEHSPVMETLGSFDEVDVTTATNKMATVLTQIAINGSQNNTALFSGNHSDIPGGSDLPTAFYENSTDVSSLLRNYSWELDPQSNETHGVTVRPLENATTILSVKYNYWQDRIRNTLNIYVPPFLDITGTIGNVLSVITLQNRHFRYSSTGFILTALTAVDIALLNTGLMRLWLKFAFRIDVRDLSRISCKVHIFLTYYLHQLASWTLILLTSERTIALWFPLRCKELCSKRRIVIAWLVIAACLFAENSVFFPAFDLQPTKSYIDANNVTKVEYTCTISDVWDHFFHDEWRFIDAIVGDFFPFLVILIGNILTITRILKSHWERKTQMGAASTTKPMASTTAMLIGISAMFLILNLPIDILFLYYANTDLNLLPKEESATYGLVYAVFTLFYYSNNALDFIMYLVSGGKFRQAFLETFLPCRKTTNQNVQRTNERSCNG